MLRRPDAISVFVKCNDRHVASPRQRRYLAGVEPALVLRLLDRVLSRAGQWLIPVNADSLLASLPCSDQRTNRGRILAPDNELAVFHERFSQRERRLMRKILQLIRLFQTL